jgi:hypothetical protein
VLPGAGHLGEVLRFSAVALFAVGLDVAALTLGGAFVWFTVHHRWPHRRIARAPIIATGDDHLSGSSPTPTSAPSTSSNATGR